MGLLAGRNLLWKGFCAAGGLLALEAIDEVRLLKLSGWSELRMYLCLTSSVVNAAPVWRGVFEEAFDSVEVVESELVERVDFLWTWVVSVEGRLC